MILVAALANNTIECNVKYLYPEVIQEELTTKRNMLNTSDQKKVVKKHTTVPTIISVHCSAKITRCCSLNSSTQTIWCANALFLYILASRKLGTIKYNFCTL